MPQKDATVKMESYVEYKYSDPIVPPNVMASNIDHRIKGFSTSKKILILAIKPKPVKPRRRHDLP